jgi:hypothetical protein
MWKRRVSAVAVVVAAAVTSYGYGNLVASYRSPAAYPNGLGYVNATRMVCTTNPSSPPKYVYFLNRTTGTVAASFLMSGTSTVQVWGCDSGSVWSSGRYIWIAWEQGTTENRIARFTTTGSLITNFYTPSASPMGIGLYSRSTASYLYYTDVGNSYLYRLHPMTGSLYGSYHLSFVPGDLAYDPDHDCFWIAGTSANHVYQTTSTGSITASFRTATPQPRGVGYESDRGYLWVGESTTVISVYETAGTAVTPISFGKVKTIFR